MGFFCYYPEISDLDVSFAWYIHQTLRVRPELFVRAFSGLPRPSVGWLEAPAHGHGRERQWR